MFNRPLSVGSSIPSVEIRSLRNHARFHTFLDSVPKAKLGLPGALSSSPMEHENISIQP